MQATLDRRRLTLAVLCVVALASPAWAHGRGRGATVRSGGSAGFARHAGEPSGIHHQDRIGRALPYHHMVGSRFTPPPASIVSGQDHGRDHGKGHGGGYGNWSGHGTGYPKTGNCGGYWSTYYRDPHHYPYRSFYGYYPYAGYYPYSGYYPYGYLPNAPVATVVVPERIVVTTPYYCGPCSVGFAGEALFLDHLRTVHAVPADGIEGSLLDLDGRTIFGGY